MWGTGYQARFWFSLHPEWVGGPLLRVTGGPAGLVNGHSSQSEGSFGSLVEVCTSKAGWLVSQCLKGRLPVCPAEALSLSLSHEALWL